MVSRALEESPESQGFVVFLGVVVGVVWCVGGGWGELVGVEVGGGFFWKFFCVCQSL